MYTYTLSDTENIFRLVLIFTRKCTFENHNYTPTQQNNNIKRKQITKYEKPLNVLFTYSVRYHLISSQIKLGYIEVKVIKL